MDKIEMIVNGDCVEVMHKFPEQMVDLIVTDPPYGINYVSHKQNCDTRSGMSITKDRPTYFSKIANDDRLPTEWLLDAYRVLRDGGAMYVFGHWSKWGELYDAVSNAGFKCKNMIVLVKSNHGMGDLRGQFAPKHELLLFAVKGRHLLRFPNGRMKDVWDVPVRYSGAKRLHPNEKPISWIEPCITNSSVEGNLVLDPFAGSGSTGVAARNMDRRCILIEVDPELCKTAAERLGIDKSTALSDHKKDEK